MHTTRVDQPFYFSKRGGVVDIFSMQYDHPIRIDLFDDEIDYIKFFDEKTQRTIEKVDEIEIIPATDLLYLDQEVGSSCYTNQRFFWRTISKDGWFI